MRDADKTTLELRRDIIEKKRQNVNDEITLKEYVELAKTTKETYETTTIVPSIDS
jgi:hypothetical protein